MKHKIHTIILYTVIITLAWYVFIAYQEQAELRRTLDDGLVQMQNDPTDYQQLLDDAFSNLGVSLSDVLNDNSQATSDSEDTVTSIYNLRISPALLPVNNTIPSATIMIDKQPNSSKITDFSIALNQNSKESGTVRVSENFNSIDFHSGHSDWMLLDLDKDGSYDLLITLFSDIKTYVFAMMDDNWVEMKTYEGKFVYDKNNNKYTLKNSIWKLTDQ